MNLLNDVQKETDYSKSRKQGKFQTQTLHITSQLHIVQKDSQNYIFNTNQRNKQTAMTIVCHN